MILMNSYDKAPQINRESAAWKQTINSWIHYTILCARINVPDHCFTFIVLHKSKTRRTSVPAGLLYTPWGIRTPDFRRERAAS